MRKSFVLAAVVFAAAITFAQSNQASVSQTGYYSTANVIQGINLETLHGGGNSASLYQTGNFQYGHIFQLGTSNTAVLNQTDSDPAEESFIEQTGDFNTAYTDFTFGYTKQTQRGDGNTSQFDAKYGSWPAINGGIQTQIGTANYAYAGIGGTSFGNYISQIQTGNYNNAVIDGLDQSSSGFITQFGNNNSAEFYSSGSVRLLDIYIDQSGDQNNAQLFDIGNGDAYKTVNINQLGDLNDAKIYGNNTCRNNVTVTQENPDAGVSGNTAYVSFMSYQNSVKIHQAAGNKNIVKLNQGNISAVEINQIGYSNKVTGLKEDIDPEWATFSGAGAGIMQSGNSNTVRMNANGLVSVNQTGSSIVASVDQH